MKFKIDKKTKRTLAYVGIIGGCAVLALTFFTISQYEKAKYNASVTVKLSAENQLSKYIRKDPNALEDTSSSWHDHAVYWDEIRKDFEYITAGNSAAYVGTAIPAYTFSMATLVAFGLVLKHAEKTKEKEEKDV